jgi:hypothetical protein
VSNELPRCKHPRCHPEISGAKTNKFQYPNSKIQIPKSKFQNPNSKKIKFDTRIGELNPIRLNIVIIKCFLPKVSKEF